MIRIGLVKHNLGKEVSCNLVPGSLLLLFTAPLLMVSRPNTLSRKLGREVVQNFVRESYIIEFIKSTCIRRSVACWIRLQVTAASTRCGVDNLQELNISGCFENIKGVFRKKMPAEGSNKCIEMKLTCLFRGMRLLRSSSFADTGIGGICFNDPGSWFIPLGRVFILKYVMFRNYCQQNVRVETEGRTKGKNDYLFSAVAMLFLI